MRAVAESLSNPTASAQRGFMSCVTSYLLLAQNLGMGTASGSGGSGEVKKRIAMGTLSDTEPSPRNSESDQGTVAASSLTSSWSSERRNIKDMTAEEKRAELILTAARIKDLI